MMVIIEDEFYECVLEMVDFLMEKGELFCEVIKIFVCV